MDREVAEICCQVNKTKCREELWFSKKSTYTNYLA